MKLTVKQNNIAQGSYSLCLVCVLLVIFYSIYGLGPGTHMEQRIASREQSIEHQPGMTVNWAEGGPEHSFWQNITSCREYTTRFAKVRTLPIRALVSYPGSGNTWVRYLIEAATGMYTGSKFNDRSILRAGHYGEGRDYKDGSTIMQKTHHRSIYVEKYKELGLEWREDQVMTFQGRAVLVVRNPYKAILSYWNFFNTKSHTNVISEGSFQSLMFRDFVFTGASRWFELIKDWLRLGEDVYMIFYEDMVQDPVRELRKLMEYLGLTVDEGRLSCISEHLAGTFHRPVHQLTDPFSADHHIIIDNLIEKAGKIVKEKTGKNLPTDKYDVYKET
jgi:hypothetical protein